jgi:hypothetical protein
VTYWHYLFNRARLRVLRLENVPDSDASPFSNGDFYMNAWLEGQKFRVEPLEPVGGSKYGRAQFQPVSARESVKVVICMCLFYKKVRCCLDPVQGNANFLAFLHHGKSKCADVCVCVFCVWVFVHVRMCVFHQVGQNGSFPTPCQ